MHLLRFRQGGRDDVLENQECLPMEELLRLAIGAAIEVDHHIEFREEHHQLPAIPARKHVRHVLPKTLK